jgi:DNA integrity scanning protein DisA with diadenylate cyclase activity
MLFDIKKRKRSLCKVGLMAISTKRMAITLADVNMKAYLNNSDIVCKLIRRKINQVGTINKALNNKPKPMNDQKVKAFLMCP